MTRKRTSKVGRHATTGFKVEVASTNGRTSMLTRELSLKMVRLIKLGNRIDIAASACGITSKTLIEWLKRGNRVIETGSQDPIEQRYATLVRQIHRAVAKAEARDLAVVDKAGQEGDWHAAAWKLERRVSKYYAPRNSVEVSGQVDHAHALFTFDDLDLPVKVLKMIRDAIQRKKEVMEISQRKQIEVIPEKVELSGSE